LKKPQLTMHLACRLRRCTVTSICYKSSYTKFYFVHDWVYGVCHVFEERLSETTVWSVLLGPYDFTARRGLKVRSPLYNCQMILTGAFATSHFIVNNILEGLIWFWVPACLVICNDVFAYIWGVTFGRTPLIKLSPKKTVEGFVGAFFSTIVFGVLWGSYFMRFDYMLCPVQDLGVSAWSSTECQPNPVFVWREWEMWKPLAVLASAIVSYHHHS
jgi:CDP-diglyceride synthetase